jgi:hypothetical protein
VERFVFPYRLILQYVHGRVQDLDDEWLAFPLSKRTVVEIHDSIPVPGALSESKTSVNGCRRSPNWRKIPQSVAEPHTSFRIAGFPDRAGAGLISRSRGGPEIDVVHTIEEREEAKV